MEDSFSWVYVCIGVAGLVTSFCVCCVGGGCNGSHDVPSVQTLGSVVTDFVPPQPVPVKIVQGYIVLTNPTTGQQQVYAPVGTPVAVATAHPARTAPSAPSDEIV